MPTSTMPSTLFKTSSPDSSAAPSTDSACVRMPTMILTTTTSRLSTRMTSSVFLTADARAGRAPESGGACAGLDTTQGYEVPGTGASVVRARLRVRVHHIRGECHMPEVPEVEHAARVLRAATVGRRVTRVRVLHASLRAKLPPRDQRRLTGLVVRDVVRRGKHQ